MLNDKEKKLIAKYGINEKDAEKYLKDALKARNDEKGEKAKKDFDAKELKHFYGIFETLLKNASKKKESIESVSCEQIIEFLNSDSDAKEFVNLLYETTTSADVADDVGEVGDNKDDEDDKEKEEEEKKKQKKKDDDEKDKERDKDNKERDKEKDKERKKKEEKMRYVVDKNRIKEEDSLDNLGFIIQDVEGNYDFRSIGMYVNGEELTLVRLPEEIMWVDGILVEEKNYKIEVPYYIIQGFKDVKSVLYIYCKNNIVVKIWYKRR
jgi:hypothetical protein